MYRATTPTTTFTLEVEASSLSQVLVTFAQDDVKLNKHYRNGTLPDGMTFDDKKVIVKLTQEETLLFDEGKQTYAQLRAKTSSGDVVETKKFNVVVHSSLNEEIL